LRNHSRVCLVAFLAEVFASLHVFRGPCSKAASSTCRIEVLGCPSKEEARPTMLNDYTGLGRASSYRYLQSSTTGAKPP
jgi:hypothetical protein